MSQSAPRTSEPESKAPGALIAPDGCTLAPVQFAACLEHDLDYATGRISRAEADRKLFDAIYPISPMWAWIFWLGVRLGAASRYRHVGRREPTKPSDQVRDV